MMRYRTSPHFKEIEDCLRDTLSEFGLIARLAKDRAIVDDLWENIVLYMRHSRFGIALFEDIDEREFNPNISLELGYMYALGKRCLLLKRNGCQGYQLIYMVGSIATSIFCIFARPSRSN